jgi:cytochrome c
LALAAGLFAGQGDFFPAAWAADGQNAVATSEGEEFEGLPDGLGREAVYFNCTACHSIRQVSQQRMARQDWDKLLDWMVETNGMHPLKPWARTRILNYLATHFGPEVGEDWGNLPPGEGRELVFYTCQACHSLAIVKQQGLSREFWDDTLVWMVEEQGMPEIDAEDRTRILDYLAANFGPDSRRR